MPHPHRWIGQPKRVCGPCLTSATATTANQRPAWFMNDHHGLPFVLDESVAEVPTRRRRGSPRPGRAPQGYLSPGRRPVACQDLPRSRRFVARLGIRGSQRTRDRVQGTTPTQMVTISRFWGQSGSFGARVTGIRRAPMEQSSCRGQVTTAPTHADPGRSRHSQALRGRGQTGDPHRGPTEHGREIGPIVRVCLQFDAHRRHSVSFRSLHQRRGSAR
jgi:hypothetical protein